MDAPSRLFIRNLPEKLSTEDLRRHFSQQTPTTDAKFLPRRRIGYVGYKTHQEAAKAVKFFNKSFLGTCRLKVELSRPTEGAQDEGTAEVQTGSDSTRTGFSKGQKRAQTEGQNGNDNVSNLDGREEKLQEYLQVMRPPSKFKIWENDDGVTSNEITAPLSEPPLAMEAHNDSDDEYQSIPAKRRKVEPDSLRAQADLPSPPNTPKGAIDNIDDQQDVGPLGPIELEVRPEGSDKDWLHSKTSRLLDMIGDEDDLETRLVDKPIVPPSPPAAASHVARPDGVSGLNNDHEHELQARNDDDGTIGSVSNGRLFVRNLAYTTTAEELQRYIEESGHDGIEEILLPTDSWSGKNKGFAHVQFHDVVKAAAALHALDRQPFQGRIIHVLPGNNKSSSTLSEFEISKLPHKKQQLIKKKSEASTTIFNWNAMFMNNTAVLASISDRLKVSKSDLIDPTSSDSAVKQAHAETHVIQETKAYFVSHGINLEAFKTKDRGGSALLVKNFSYNTKPDELKDLFAPFGPIIRIMIPPAGTIAIVEYEHSAHADAAFKNIAYRKFKESILFLEKAPRNLFTGSKQASATAPVTEVSKAHSSKDMLFEGSGETVKTDTSTLFVRNLNFVTTNTKLEEAFMPMDGFLSAKVKTRLDAKKPGQILSMGFGFIEFRSHKQAQAAMAAMDGTKLDGHDLIVREAQRSGNVNEEKAQRNRSRQMANSKTKIIIKNLPFEATKKDVRALFEAYGQLRSVRVPKKFDSSTRGFAFADFTTPREAENAIDALRDTHLLGRRLVLEFVAEEATDPELEIQAMQKKVGSQSDKVALQQLIAGSGRKKFEVEGGDEADAGLRE